MRLILSLFIIFLVSCGGDSSSSSGGSSGGDSDYTSVVLPTVDILCGGSNCVSNSSNRFLSAISSVPASDYSDVVRRYKAGKSVVDNDIQETIDEMDAILVEAGIDSCDDIPSSGNTSVNGDLGKLKIIFGAGKSTDMFGKAVTFDKKITAKIGSRKIFQAYLTCGSVTAAILEGDYTDFDDEDYMYKVHLYEDGSVKHLALYQDFDDGDGPEKYMMHFNTSGGKQFNVSMADTSIPAVIVLQQNSSKNNLRLAYSENPSADLTAGSLTTITTTANGTNHTCIDGGDSSQCTDWTSEQPAYSGVTTEPVPPLTSGSFNFNISGLSRIDFESFQSL